MKKHSQTAVLILFLVFFIMPQLATAESIFERIFKAQVFKGIFGITDCIVAMSNCQQNLSRCKERVTVAATACSDRKEASVKRCEASLQRAKDKERALARSQNCKNKADAAFSKCQSTAVERQARNLASCTRTLQSCLSRIQRQCPGI